MEVEDMSLLEKVAHIKGSISEPVQRRNEKRSRVIPNERDEIECAVCLRLLHLNEYDRNPGNVCGYASTCKACHRLRKYGMTVYDYQVMLADQGGVCLICGSPGKPVVDQLLPLHVDHCHETGKVRGLLCGTCNRGLGFFGDNLAGIRRVEAYLMRFE